MNKCSHAHTNTAVVQRIERTERGNQTLNKAKVSKSGPKATGSLRWP